ncbi:MAG: HAD family hydrolase [Nanoarchaeota archaeon]
MVKIIAFDMWQTLADYPFNLYEEVLRVAKLSMKLQEFIIKKGKASVSSDLNDKDRFLEKMKVMGVTDKKILKKISNLYYKAHENIFLYKDALDTLNYLKCKGYVLALITNVDRYAQERVLQLFPKDIFDHVITSFEIGYKKPEKEIFLALSEKYDIDPSEIVMVGDTEITDILPALRLGWKTVFINRKRMVSKKADYTISSLRELTEIF